MNSTIKLKTYCFVLFILEEYFGVFHEMNTVTSNLKNWMFETQHILISW